VLVFRSYQQTSISLANIDEDNFEHTFLLDVFLPHPAIDAARTYLAEWAVPSALKAKPITPDQVLNRLLAIGLAINNS
jgi:hypothetical protein